MKVAVAYQFHDSEPKLFVLDTSKLCEGHPFENALREALEENQESFVCLDGNQFGDQWGNLDNAKVPCPTNIDAMKIVKIDFEG